MQTAGLLLCSRYSYPPNSLSLCGPDKQRDLIWYSSGGKIDKGTVEILSQFTTLFPYLSLIAKENNIRDPFDPRVVEAYWLGNSLLHQIPASRFIKHLSQTLGLEKRLNREKVKFLFGKIANGAFPHHSFHVLNLYKRTGHFNVSHTVETMDACIVNFGKIKKIKSSLLMVETRPLRLLADKFVFGSSVLRTIRAQGEKDAFFTNIRLGDWVSYHWGFFCQKLNTLQLRNLIYYTKLSLDLANIFR